MSSLALISNRAVANSFVRVFTSIPSSLHFLGVLTSSFGAGLDVTSGDRVAWIGYTFTITTRKEKKSDSSHYWHADRADSLQHNPECLKSELDHEKFADRAITIVFM